MNAIVFEDKENDQYTITLDANGGPIISHKDLKECKRIFEEAYHLAVSVGKLNKFKRDGAWDKEDYDSEIEYIDLLL